MHQDAHFFYFILDVADGSGAVCAVKQEPKEYEEHANSSMDPMEPIVKIEAGIYIFILISSPNNFV